MQEGDFATAVKLFVPVATQGDANVQFLLGLCLRSPGSQQDYAGAVKWLAKSAAQGDDQAQLHLGNLYRDGLGVPEDPAEAERWWLKAAGQGHPAAFYNLGNLYRQEPVEGPSDLAKAYHYYALAVSHYEKSITSGSPLERHKRDAIKARRACWWGLKKEQLLVALSRIRLSKHHPILQAARAGNVDRVQTLLDEGADVDTRFKDGNTPLVFAVFAGHRPTVALLLSRGADANAKSQKLLTPLHVAAQRGDEGLVRLILEYGGKVDARAVGDTTPLFLGVSGGSVSAVKALLENEGFLTADCLTSDRGFPLSHFTPVSRERLRRRRR